MATRGNCFPGIKIDLANVAIGTFEDVVFMVLISFNCQSRFRWTAVACISRGVMGGSGDTHRCADWFTGVLIRSDVTIYIVKDNSKKRLLCICNAAYITETDLGVEPVNTYVAHSGASYR